MQAAAGCAARRMNGILGGRPVRVQMSRTWSYQFLKGGLSDAVCGDGKPNRHKGL
jgi:hypothetical protein